MKPRLDLRRVRNGPVLLALFGVEIQAGRLMAEAAFVAQPIKRPVTLLADGLKVRIRPVKWSGFSVESIFLDQIHIEVQHGEAGLLV